MGRFKVSLTKASLHVILRDCFYAGAFEWEGCWYIGTHPLFLRPGLFFRTQAHVRKTLGNQTGAFSRVAGSDQPLLDRAVRSETYGQ
jgi:hypothetical protein